MVSPELPREANPAWMDEDVAYLPRSTSAWVSRPEVGVRDRAPVLPVMSG